MLVKKVKDKHGGSSLEIWIREQKADFIYIVRKF